MPVLVWSPAVNQNRRANLRHASTASVPQFRCLLGDNPRELGVRVSQRRDADARDEVEILVSIDVVEIRAASACDHNRCAAVRLDDMCALSSDDI